MTSPAFDPLRLHVAHFAADAGHAEGDWAIAELPRLADSECPPEAGGPPRTNDPARRVTWQATGSHRPVGGEDQVWLHVLAGADVILQCQRCLQPLAEALRVDRHFRFVKDEETAAALDDEMEDEVLALPKTLDLRELVEDELLLALPLVPRHDVCPQAVPMQFGDVAEVEEKANPFASLALLRKDKDGDGGPDIV